ncbi:MAG: isochorismate synthase [Verrucomicrobia bacterium]|nr:isochorismate synthase [Verrucomicrobiota bacterium]
MIPAAPSQPALRIGRHNDLHAPHRSARPLASGIRRIEWTLEDEGLFSPRWLECAPLFPRFFWRSRSGGDQTLAMGSAAFGSLADLLEILEDGDPGIRVFGGCRFDAASHNSSDWADFPDEYFFVPKAEIIRSGGRTTLAVNLSDNETDLSDVSNWIERLGDTGAAPRPGVLTRWDQPNFTGWAEAVDRALQEFQSGPLEKVVLARKSCLELTETITPFALVEILAGGAPACFHFCLQPTANSGAFLGASPELLFRREGGRLESEAVAGTRPRSLDTVEDERLESQLLKMSKEQLEHRLVVDSLETTFRELCAEFSQDTAPSVLKLSRVQHLRTAIAGQLNDGVGDDAILRAFHPTPATCGSPCAAAARFIAENELFDRGWYAGPVGFVSRDEAEFAVAIRSMLCLGRKTHVYAGAGIVDGSESEREWNELEDKIASVLHLLAP